MLGPVQLRKCGEVLRLTGHPVSNRLRALLLEQGTWRVPFPTIHLHSKKIPLSHGGELSRWLAISSATGRLRDQDQRDMHAVTEAYTNWDIYSKIPSTMSPTGFCVGVGMGVMWTLSASVASSLRWPAVRRGMGCPQYAGASSYPFLFCFSQTTLATSELLWPHPYGPKQGRGCPDIQLPLTTTIGPRRRSTGRFGGCVPSTHYQMDNKLMKASGVFWSSCSAYTEKSRRAGHDLEVLYNRCGQRGGRTWGETQRRYGIVLAEVLATPSLR